MSTINELRQRFDNLVANTRRTLRIDPPESAEPTPEQILTGDLAGWAAMSACQHTFMPWLEKQIGAAHMRISESRHVHSEMSYMLGYESALQNLYNRFRVWSEAGRAGS